MVVNVSWHTFFTGKFTAPGTDLFSVVTPCISDIFLQETLRQEMAIVLQGSLHGQESE